MTRNSTNLHTLAAMHFLIDTWENLLKNRLLSDAWIWTPDVARAESFWPLL